MSTIAEVIKQIDAACTERRHTSRVQMKLGALSVMCQITRNRYDPDIMKLTVRDEFFREDPFAKQRLAWAELNRYRRLLKEARDYLTHIAAITEPERSEHRSQKIGEDIVMLPS